MRYSMIKAATVALFGLSNVFLGVNASPIDGYEVQDVSWPPCPLVLFNNLY